LNSSKVVASPHTTPFIQHSASSDLTMVAHSESRTLTELPVQTTSSASQYRLGVDVGVSAKLLSPTRYILHNASWGQAGTNKRTQGTFTDVCVITPSGEIVRAKTPSTPHDQSIGVKHGIEKVREILKEKFGWEGKFSFFAPWHYSG
jgi:hypothetical protein